MMNCNRRLPSVAQWRAAVRCAAMLLVVVLATDACGEDVATKKPQKDLLRVTGVAVDAASKPAAKARVVVQTYPADTELATDELGRFEISAPKQKLKGRVILVYGANETIGEHHLPYDEKELAKLGALRIELKPTVVVRLHVVDSAGKPVAKALCGGMANFVVFGGRETDDDGRAKFRIPADAQLHNVYAVKSGLGLDYRAYFDPKKYQTKEPQTKPSLEEPIELKLEGAQTIRVRAIDDSNEEPVPGASTYLWLTKKPGEVDDLNLGYFTKQLAVKTDDRGWATFDWIPGWEERNQLTFWSMHDEYGHLRGNYDLDKGEGLLVMRQAKLVKLSGRVIYPDGRPAKGIGVQAVGAGYSMDEFREATVTDAEGRYEIKADANKIYLVVALDRKWAATRDGFAVLAGQPREDIDLTLQPATRIHGRVTVGPDRRPVKDFRVTSYQNGRGLHALPEIKLPNLDGNRFASRPTTFHNAVTDDRGEYEFFVGPGSFDVRGPSQTKIQEFKVVDQKEIEFNFHSERPEEGTLEGVVLDAESGEPVAEAKVIGIYRHPLGGSDLDVTTDAMGKFSVNRELHRTVLHVRSSDRQKAAVVEIGPDDESVKIRIGPVARVTGVLIDKQTKNPAAGKKVEYGIRVPQGDDDAPWRTAFGGVAITDSEGKFVLEHLVPGKKYEAHVMNEDGQSYAHVTEITPKNAEPVDLGKVEYSPSVVRRD